MRKKIIGFSAFMLSAISIFTLVFTAKESNQTNQDKVYMASEENTGDPDEGMILFDIAVNLFKK